MYSYPLGTLSPLRTHHQLLLLPIEYLLSRRHTVPPATTLQVTSTPQRPPSTQPSGHCHLLSTACKLHPQHLSTINKHLSILLGSINDHINPRHRLTIPKHQHLQHRNNEEISPHPINHHPALNQPPTLLQLHLNRRNPPFPLALQPPLSKHRRPQHSLPSRLSRSFASPLKHDSQRQSSQHPGARVTDVDDGAQTQLGRLRAPARRLHLVPGLRRDQRWCF